MASNTKLYPPTAPEGFSLDHFSLAVEYLQAYEVLYSHFKRCTDAWSRRLVRLNSALSNDEMDYTTDEEVLINPGVVSPMVVNLCHALELLLKSVISTEIPAHARHDLSELFAMIPDSISASVVAESKMGLESIEFELQRTRQYFDGWRYPLGEDAIRGMGAEQLHKLATALRDTILATKVSPSQ